MGLLLGYFLFVPLFLRLVDAIGNKWIIAALVLLPLILLIYIQVPLVQLTPFLLVSAMGYVAGALANKALWKFAPGVMAKLGA